MHQQLTIGSLIVCAVRQAIFVDDLPLNGTQKVLKNKPRDEYGDVLIREK